MPLINNTTPDTKVPVLWKDGMEKLLFREKWREREEETAP